jgi:ketosteroid isomerase-like protein
MATKGNAEMVRELYRAMERKDMETIDRCGGDALWENVPFGETTTLRRDAETNLTAFPDLRFELRNVIEQGNCVVVEGIARGTHAGILRTAQGDIGPTNRRFEARFVDVYEVAGDRVRAGRFYSDVWSLFQQLGLGADAAQGQAAAPATH